MPAIETTALTKHFGDVVAVENLDFAVEEGEIFGFLGPNGAGKSTTINMLLGFISPTSGSAEVLGRDVTSEAEAIRSRIGVLPEGFDVYERLTGREHVQYAIDVKGADDDPAELVETVGLTPDEADRAAGGYSKGMTQRLALGMALVGDPDLLILDEPSSGLDPNGMQEMRELVRAEAASGTTVFFSSHILPEVQAVCDRVGVMSDGDLAALDTIEGLREAAGGRSTLTLTLDAIPDDPGLAGMDGVVDVTADGSDLVVGCTDDRAKIEVVRTVDERATVLDITSEDTSLEELFSDLTSEGETSGDRGEPAEVVA